MKTIDEIKAGIIKDLENIIVEYQLCDQYDIELPTRVTEIYALIDAIILS